MAIKPILFNTEMVKAILDGRKTQTRRIMKPQPEWSDCGMRWFTKECWWREGWNPMESITPKEIPIKKGDILWVRETWCDPNPENPCAPLMYKADFPMHWDADQTEHGEPLTITAEEMKWIPSIHMPKEAARIFLRVRDVRVERLNDILAHAGEVSKEGIPYSDEWDIEASGLRFKEIWNSTVKKADLDEYGWEGNPWVWVIEFERCEKPEGW